MELDDSNQWRDRNVKEHLNDGQPRTSTNGLDGAEI